MAVGIKPEVIQEQIAKLKAAQLALEGLDCTPPTVQGGGKSVAELEALGQRYAEMQTRLVALMAACEGLLQESLGSFEATDSEIATAVQQEGGAV